MLFLSIPPNQTKVCFGVFCRRSKDLTEGYNEENLLLPLLITNREIIRVTNWCEQERSYKAAEYTMKLKKEWMEQHKGHPIHEFHLQYLKAGAVPLPVLRKQLIS